MSVQYLTQRKHIVDQVLTGLELTEKSHLISFEKIQRLLAEAMEGNESLPQTEQTFANSLQSLEDYLLPQFQLLVANCKFGKKYLNIRQRLHVEQIRNINYSDEEYIKDLDNLKQIGNKYKKEIDEICLEETLNLFGNALHHNSIGISFDGYQLRKYMREKDQGESNAELEQFVKEIENFLHEQFQNELILQAKEASKTTVNFFFQRIQANPDIDVSRLSKDLVNGGIGFIENQKNESFIRGLVNQIVLLTQSYTNKMEENRMMNDEDFGTLCLSAAMERFFNQKKSIYQASYIQEAIKKDMETLLPTSLEKSIEKIMNGSVQSSVDHVKTLKTFARETNPSMSLMMNSNEKIFSEATGKEISLAYTDASDELSKKICQASMKIINSGDFQAATYKFTLTPRLIQDASLKTALFYGSREEKQNSFKGILANLIKEINPDFTEDNIVPINFLDQFQALELEVVFVKKNGQLAIFPSEKMNVTMKKHKFIKAELTEVFKYLQLDQSMFNTEFSQRLNDLDAKKIFSSFSGF